MYHELKLAYSPTPLSLVNKKIHLVCHTKTLTRQVKELRAIPIFVEIQLLANNFERMGHLLQNCIQNMAI